jgi:hypothetical protein
MKILFDQGAPAPLRNALTAHTISTAYEMGWSHLDNGELLKPAEERFDAFITTDKNLRYQQNLQHRRVGDSHPAFDKLANDPGLSEPDHRCR